MNQIMSGFIRAFQNRLCECENAVNSNIYNNNTCSGSSIEQQRDENSDYKADHGNCSRGNNNSLEAFAEFHSCERWNNDKTRYKE